MTPTSVYCAKTEQTNIAQFNLWALVEQCLETRKDELWIEFIRRTQPTIVRTIIRTLRCCGGQIRAGVTDDLVQDTYLKLCSNDFNILRDFKNEHEHSFLGFLKTVAANVAHDYFRASLSQRRGGGCYHLPLDKISGSVEVARSGISAMERHLLLEQAARLLACRGSDPRNLRECAIFWLYFRFGFSSKAIARLRSMGLTVKGVESTIFRLTQHLKERLGHSRDVALAKRT